MQRVIAVLAELRAGSSSRILAGDILAPPEIEKMSGAAGGHWHGGDLTLDRLGAAAAGGWHRALRDAGAWTLSLRLRHASVRRRHRHQRTQCRRGRARCDDDAGAGMSIVRSLNATALHARTADLCATNQWIEDSGFTVPASYSSPREEQWAFAERAALSDLSARQVWSFRGADAASFLSVCDARTTRRRCRRRARKKPIGATTAASCAAKAR